MCNQVCEWVISKFNGTSTPKGSYSAKLSYESNQSPPEKYAMVKWMQSPRQNVKSHAQKKSSNEQGNAHSRAHYGPWPAKVAG